MDLVIDGIFRKIYYGKLMCASSLESGSKRKSVEVIRIYPITGDTYLCDPSKRRTELHVCLAK